MPDTLGRIYHLLQQKQWILGTAESLTGGLLGARLCEYSGISQVYGGGVIAYQYAVKTRLLQVDAEYLAASGAVNPNVAKQMALGVRKALGCAVGVSTTGVAGPGSSEGKPAGLAYIGIVTPEYEDVLEFRGRGDRNQIREQVVQAALAHLEFSLAQDSGRL